jgi:cation diffusion facilitator family transporter
VERRSLTKFAWLSIVAAVTTISLKLLAYRLTGSVGLLSDALESGVNLAAAIIALVTLIIASRPPDEDHAFGHGKAEYFSSAAEGMLILLAAGSIAWTAVRRFVDPQPLEAVGVGLAISLAASAVNLGVAQVLLRAGKRYHSITLEADAHHLMTDVWTSVGILVGIGLVVVTQWYVLDAIIAMLVAANIVWSGIQLVRRSTLGLMDTAIPAEEQKRVRQILDDYANEGVRYHALLTRQAAERRFVSVHVLVPDAWSVQRGHALVERLEDDIRQAIPNTSVFTHLEPLDDPASFDDITIDRVRAPRV